MTAVLSAGFRTHMNGETTELTTCIYMRRRDSTEFRFTEFDRDIVLTGSVTDSRGRVMDGTYLATQGETPSSIDSSSVINVDSLDILTVLGSPGITEPDMIAGVWDYADFDIFQVVHSDLSLGVHWLMSGKLGEVSISKGSDTGTVELRSKSVLLQEKIGRIITHECPVDLGDTECNALGLHPSWAASTAYLLGDRVRPAVYERVEFVCTTAGTTGTAEPVWNLALDSTTTDNTATWTAYSPLKPSEWQISRVYALNDVVSPSAFDKRRYTCTTAGTAGGSEPTWTTTIDGTTADNTAVWTAGLAWAWEGTVTTATDSSNFEDTSLTDADASFVDDWFKYGLLTWLTGNNAGIESEIKTHTETGGVLELWKGMPYAIQVGDTFLIEAGCDKSRVACRDKFVNIVNFRAFPWVPGRDALYQTPGSKQ